MNRENVHENTHLNRGFTAEGVNTRLNADHLSMSRCDHGARQHRNIAGGISEKLQNQAAQQPERQGPPQTPEHLHGQSNCERNCDPAPAFTRDQRLRQTLPRLRAWYGLARAQLRSLSTSLPFWIQGIMDRSFSPTASI